MSEIQSFPGQTIKCRAAVCYGPNTPLVVENIDVAPPKAGEVRIKVIASGICHTDLHFTDNHLSAVYPIILGHEGSGIVESVGEGVTSVAVGDHVIPVLLSQCKECDWCVNRADSNLCQRFSFKIGDQPGVMEDGTTRFSSDGKPIYQLMNVSSFSEYTVVPWHSCTKIPKDAPLDKVCLLGCGISTGYGSALNVAKVKKGSSVAIWGLGGVGLSAVMGAKAAGAATIVGIDTNPEKFKTAMEFGATECINPNDLDKPIQLHVAEKYNGGFDFTIECVGNVKTMQTALECTHIGWGVNVVVGVGAQNTMIQVNPLLMVMGVQVRGSALGGLKGRDGIAELVGKYMNKEIKVDELITHTFKLDQINEAVENLRQGKGLRSIVHL